jgi:hypothetical protein
VDDAHQKAHACKVLNFPNHSRFYDEAVHAVRFWGHDGAMEAAFFVDEDALEKIEPGVTLNEASLLAAFDAHREMIWAVAVKVYGRGRKGAYDLRRSDF